MKRTDLEAGDIGAEEGGELAPTPGTLTLVTQLVIQHIRLHLHLPITAPVTIFHFLVINI